MINKLTTLRLFCLLKRKQFCWPGGFGYALASHVCQPRHLHSCKMNGAQAAYSLSVRRVFSPVG